MTNLQKLNKLLIVVIILSILGYIMNIVNLTVFVGEFTQIASQIQTAAAFIPNQDVQNINSVLEFANNAVTVVRNLMIAIATVSSIASLIVLFLVKTFSTRMVKYNSLFTQLGLIIVSAGSLYLHYRLLPAFDGLVSLFIIFITVAIMLISAAYIAIGCLSLYKLVSSDDFEAAKVGYDLAKTLSLVTVFYIAAIIGFKVTIYISVAILVRGIDLAAMIDLTNLINIDWTAIIPAQVFESGVISPERIDFLVNNAADQYLFSYLSDVVQQLILSISRSIIFKGIISYIAALASGLGILYTIKKNFEYKKYIAIALMTTVSIISFVYVGGLLINILILGYSLCIILICIDIFKEYRGN